MWVAGVDPLGRERQAEVLARLEAGGFEGGQDHLLGGARVGRALEDDELPRPQVFSDLLDGGHDEGQVRVLRLPERGRYADVDRVEGPDHGEVARGREAPRIHLLGDLAVFEIHDVGSPPVDGVDLGAVHIDTGHVEPGTGELEGQRQSNIAEPDDTAPRLATADSFVQFTHGCRPSYAAGGASRTWSRSQTSLSARWGASSALGRYAGTRSRRRRIVDATSPPWIVSSNRISHCSGRHAPSVERRTLMRSWCVATTSSSGSTSSSWSFSPGRSPVQTMAMSSSGSKPDSRIICRARSAMRT